MEQVVSDACLLRDELVCQLRVDDVVEQTFDDDEMSKNILGKKDLFKTKFISGHERFLNLKSEVCGENGKKLRVCDNLQSVASNDKPVYVFIHGLGGLLEQFEPLLRLVDALEARFVAVDLPGFGQSDELIEYPMKSVVRYLHSIFETLHIDKSPLMLVGHSMGCYMILHYLAIYNNTLNCQRLIMLSPPQPDQTILSKESYFRKYVIGALSAVPWVFDCYRKWFDQWKGMNSSGIQQFFYNKPVTNEQKYRRLWQYCNNLQIKSRSLLYYLYGWDPIDWEYLLSNADKKLSIRILCGDHDIVTPMLQSEVILQKFEEFDDRKLKIVVDCGHNLCFDAPEQVCKAFYEEVISD